MPSPNIALQGALITRIKAIATASGARVTNLTSPGMQYPYVVVFAGYETPVDEECWDRTETTLQVDVWGDQANHQHVKPIAAAIRDALHEQSLTVVGFVVDRIRVDGIAYTDTPPTYRARLSINVDTQPIP